MHILVTGGAGYIGSVTVRTLLDAGHSVTVLDTLEKGWNAAVDARAALKIGSVGDRVALDRVLPGCDAVMHLAGYIEVAESQADPGRYFANNVSAPQVMLDAMADHGVDALVFSSTAAVYGRPMGIPIHEDAETLPINAYGESKLAFEKLLEASAETAGIRSIRLRYFNAAGAWPDGSLGEAHRPETHLIPSVLTAMQAGASRFEVFGGDYDTPDGTCVRDYVHVCDLAEAHRLALERLGQGGPGGVLNLGSGCGYSNLEVVAACAEVSGCTVAIEIGPRRAGDPASLVASHDLASSDLGWIPRRSDLRTIVEDAWRWHSAHPAGYGKGRPKAPPAEPGPDPKAGGRG
ncbi:MAG TPA: UDP-glucose 4-epimerase GalE [Coriobacteriia bacterium]